MPADLLVVGLGNPGDEYARTRHNAGADVVEILAKRHGARLRRSKDRALVDDVRVDGRKLVLAIPTTYMNESGQAVAALVRRHDVTPDRLVIVHDELDLPSAALRVKVGGGLAGHNGLRSIKQHLKTDEFLRVRIGVGKPPTKEQGADHVLSRLGRRARDEMAVTLEDAADAVETILVEGVDAAMNRYNAPR
jgi:PTH1 family peptidyl-tRNA hydrolase